MTTEATQVTSTADAGAPPLDADAAKYEELRKELDIEADGGESEPEPNEPGESEPASEPATKTKPSYDELEASSRKTAAALRDAREAQRASDERLAGIMELVNRSRAERQPEAKQEPPKIPDVQEDPIGHFKALYEQQQAKIDALERGGSQTAEQLQAKAQHDQLLQIVQHSETHITSDKNPEAKADYWDACAYLEGQRERELARMYPDGSPYVQQYAQSQGFRTAAELRQAVLNHDRWAVAVQAVQMGVSPAEFYYSLATDRGYQAKANGKANGKDVSLADKAKQQLDAAKRGAKSSVTLSGDTGGRKGANDMSMTDLANLFIEDPEAADKVWEQMARSGKLG